MLSVPARMRLLSCKGGDRETQRVRVGGTAIPGVDPRGVRMWRRVTGVLGAYGPETLGMVSPPRAFPGGNEHGIVS